MDITIIRAGMFSGKGKDAMKPVAFGILAALTPPEASLTFLDDRREQLPERIDSQIIAFSVDTFSAKRAYQLAEKYKTAENVIVMGGFHPTVCREEAMEHADVVLIGDAEDTWPSFLEDWKQGRWNRVYERRGEPPKPMVKNLGMQWIYRGKGYLKLGVLQFSRGCKFCCDFCSIKAMYPGAVRQKPIADFIEEVRSAKEKLLFFADDNLLLDETSARQLFSALKPLKKKWACQISLEAAEKEELLALMKESGCVLVLIGFESLKEQNLEQMNKQANLRIASYSKGIEAIYRQGLMIYGTFVLGYDGDTADEALRIMEFAMEHKLAAANFNPLIPMPGTPLYARLERENRLLYQGKWWLADNYHYGDTAFRPEKMTPEELRDACRDVRYRFYSLSGIWKRLRHLKLYKNPSNFIIYMVVNLVSAAEIRRKQGQLLGGTK